MQQYAAPGGTFNVLSLDGGGTRGIYSAQLLACIEEATDAPIAELFNLIAGTSTGAIVAGAAATGIPMSKTVRLFETESLRIFQKRWFSWLHIRSKYPRHPLEQAIKTHLPQKNLGEIKTPLMITSSDISTGGVHIFKSRYLQNLGESYVRDADVALSDAILASCVAPTYFDPIHVNQLLLADGGLWANNPSIIALTEAVSKFGCPVEQIHLLSIGTGHAVNLYTPRKRWGLVTGWGRRKLVDYVLRLQSEASANMAELLLQGRYLRLDPKIEHWALDDLKHISTLKALATKTFARQNRAIAKNLHIQKWPSV